MSEPHENWLAKAEDDQDFAALGLEHEYFSQVCFLSQQAVEKALKAILIAKAGQYPRLHNLVELLNRCAANVPEISRFEEGVRILDQYYIPSRYPDGVPGGLPDGEPAERHAREALDLAGDIVAFCKSHVG